MDESADSVSGPGRATIAAAGPAIAEACGPDLSSLLGATVTLACEGVEPLTTDADDSEEAAVPVIHQPARTDDDPPLPLHLVLPRPDAVTLAGLQLGKPAEDVEGLRADPMDPELLAALKPVLKLVTAVAHRTLEDEGLSAIELGDPREVEGRAEVGELASGRFVRLRFKLSVENFPDGALELLLPDPSPPDEDAPTDVSACFVEVDEEAGEAIEALATALGWELSLVDPAELFRDEDRYADTSAIVVPWAVGGRSGLEIAESLARHPLTRHLRVVMASEAPTRAQVEAALRAGAASFVHQPFEERELRARLPG